MSDNTKTIAQMIPGDHISISVDNSTRPFWEAAKEHILTVCQCADCDTFRMPPRPFCPECQSKNMKWPELPGTATVYSFAICHRSPYPDLEDFTYVPVVVDIDGAPGARLVSNIVDIDPEEVKIGMKVKVDWNPIKDDWVLPIFRAAE